MKFLMYTCLLLFKSSFAFSTPVSEVRSFTRESDKKSIKAKIISYDGNQLVLRVIGKKNYTFDPTIFIEEDQQYIENWVYTSQKIPLPSELDKRIKPDTTFRVEMPNLAKTYSNQTAGFTVYLPADYEYPKPIPLLVFLNGGDGKDGVKQARKITESKGYVLVSLPYTSEINKDGPLGQVEKNMDLIESYHAAMLKKLDELIPNLSNNKVITGSSNGAHIVGSALVMGWDCYLTYFNAFALWEGGSSISRNFKAVKNKKYQVWVGWGGKSDSKNFTINIANSMEESGVKLTRQEIETAGHGINNDVISAIRYWLVNTVEPKVSNKE